MVGRICLNIFLLLDNLLFIELISFISMLHCSITFCKVEGIFLTLACQHFHSRIYSTSIHDHLQHLLGFFQLQGLRECAH